MSSTRIDIADLSSPAGEIRIAVRDGRLCGLTFIDGWSSVAGYLERRFGHVEYCPAASDDSVVSAVRAYLDGDISALDCVAVDLGGTPFQLEVWSALRSIPAGETVSYRDIARFIGAPSASRAVGAANGANPVAIVVPCHRVVRSDGDIGGYGGGIERKRWLLEHERTHTSAGLS